MDLMMNVLAMLLFLEILESAVLTALPVPLPIYASDHDAISCSCNLRNKSLISFYLLTAGSLKHLAGQCDRVPATGAHLIR